jgi:hypothetical protein
MTNSSVSGSELVSAIRRWAGELGFDQTGITGVDLSADEQRLLAWLRDGRHGEMQWMERHGVRRSRPGELIPGTVSVISMRMDYWPASAHDAAAVLAQPELGYVSRYALGRDYHKLLRTRVQRLADRIEAAVGAFNYRCFSDSAPVMEKPLARNAGLGWIGKHTNLINRRAGSWFFLAEMYTDLPLAPDPPTLTEHCGTCFVRQWVTAFTAATTASSYAHGIALLSQHAHPISSRARHSMRRGSASCSRWTLTLLNDALPAARFAASATNALCVTLPSRWAMRPHQPRCGRHCPCGSTTRRLWCASMSIGRSHSISSVARVDYPCAAPVRADARDDGAKDAHRIRWQLTVYHFRGPDLALCRPQSSSP